MGKAVMILFFIWLWALSHQPWIAFWLFVRYLFVQSERA